MFAVKHFLGKPKSIPDERMLVDPIWSTWAQFKTNINQSAVIKVKRFISVEKDYISIITMNKIEILDRNCDIFSLPRTYKAMAFLLPKLRLMIIGKLVMEMQNLIVQITNFPTPKQW